MSAAGQGEDDSKNRGDTIRLVLVTGPSGAGRSTAIKAFEDIGYEVIDNLPMSFVHRLVEIEPSDRPIALGIDVRNRDFNAQTLIELIDRLTRNPRVDLDVLYLDCQPGVLIRRFSETRRRHPLTPDQSPEEGVEREIDLLGPIRVRADHLIDTSDLTVHGLKEQVSRWYAAGSAPGLSVSVQSFSYKRGLPRGLDMIFDCRFLRNPHWDAGLRPLDGRDAAVAAYVTADPRFDEYYQKVRDLLMFLLPAHKDEGKSHLSIGFGCTGGQHRSVLMTELLANALAETGWAVSKRHRELERRAAVAAVASGAANGVENA